MKTLPTTLPDDAARRRFWSKVDQTGGCDACWPWLEYCDKDGYGRFWLCGKRVFAHRVAFHDRSGPIPPGLVIDHFECDNPPCCNPSHLRPISNRNNVLRGSSFAAELRARTHCPAGHEYDAANTFVDRAGGRRCRACMQAQTQEYRRANREAILAHAKRLRTAGLAPDDHRHGTLSAYVRYGCRCDSCRAANKRWRIGNEAKKAACARQGAP